MIRNTYVQRLCSRFLGRRRFVQCFVHALPIAAHYSSAAYGRLTTMKTLSWKSMLASLNPSPLFEAVAAFAEALATKDREICPQQSTRQEERPCHSTRR